MTKAQLARKVLPDMTPIEFHILLTLAEEDLHGYGIRIAVAKETNDELVIPLGTLYAALNRLRKADWINPFEDPSVPDTDTDRRRYYQLTALGQVKLREEIERMAFVVNNARTRLERAMERNDKPENMVGTFAPPDHSDGAAHLTKEVGRAGSRKNRRE